MFHWKWTKGKWFWWLAYCCFMLFLWPHHESVETPLLKSSAFWGVSSWWEFQRWDGLGSCIIWNKLYSLFCLVKVCQRDTFWIFNAPNNSHLGFFVDLYFYWNYVVAWNVFLPSLSLKPSLILRISEVASDQASTWGKVGWWKEWKPANELWWNKNFMSTQEIFDRVVIPVGQILLYHTEKVVKYICFDCFPLFVICVSWSHHFIYLDRYTFYTHGKQVVQYTLNGDYEAVQDATRTTFTNTLSWLDLTSFQVDTFNQTCETISSD